MPKQNQVSPRMTQKYQGSLGEVHRGTRGDKGRRATGTKDKGVFQVEGRKGSAERQWDRH